MTLYTPHSLIKSSFTKIAALTLLTACTSAPVSPVAPGNVKVEYSQTYMDGSRLKEIPTEVTIVNRAATAKNVATQVGLAALTLFIGGGIGFQGFSKDDLKGAPIEDLSERNNIQNPVSTTFVADLQTKINQAVQENAVHNTIAFNQSIVVTGGRAALVYENLGDEEEKFRLKSEIIIHKPREDKGFFSFSPNPKVDCQHASAEALPQEQWAKDNYLLIKTEMDAMFSACEQKILAELPTLLES